MYINVYRIISLITINMSDEVVYAIGQYKEVDMEFVWIVLIVLPHTSDAAVCSYTALIKGSCWA